MSNNADDQRAADLVKKQRDDLLPSGARSLPEHKPFVSPEFATPEAAARDAAARRANSELEELQLEANRSGR